MAEHILEAQVVHGPDPKHFLSVVLGDNDSIQIVKLNEVRILQDKLSEQILALGLSTPKVVQEDLSTFHLACDTGGHFN